MKRLPAKARKARRGAPADTRETLVTAAARQFNRRGYHGTDSNAIARAAGYAPGTFYLHFADKRAVFLAVYERWVRLEWDAIGARARAGTLDAATLVDLVVAHHRDWRGFRASLRALLATDAAVRRFFRARRRRQVELMGDLAVAQAGAAPPVEERVLLLLTLERVADAIADGEAEELGADRLTLITALVDRVGDYLSSVR
jgi:AcrR family transcriptional regulator